MQPKVLFTIKLFNWEINILQYSLHVNLYHLLGHELRGLNRETKMNWIKMIKGKKFKEKVNCIKMSQ